MFLSPIDSPSYNSRVKNLEIYFPGDEGAERRQRLKTLIEKLRDKRLKICANQERFAKRAKIDVWVFHYLEAGLGTPQEYYDNIENWASALQVDGVKCRQILANIFPDTRESQTPQENTDLLR